MLEVRLIGKFDIKCDGKPVILSSRAAQSLFAYLTLTAGTLHRREKLAGMLWPDESEQKARTYLRNELWRIRKVLPKTSKIEYLLADNLRVGFSTSSAYWLDVAELKNLSDTASAEELIEVLSSYQGELLPGFYEDWVVLEREHLQVLFEQKIACLLDMLEKERRWNDILEWAERWISLGQAPEAAYQALMFAYDALGDHAKVVSTYERCKQALRQLDFEPSEETRALAFKKSSKIKVPIPLTSFVGREKELKEVVGLFAKSRLITLTGSGGVGKTRLAIQVVAEILDRFPDGLWFLDLAPLSDRSLVPNTLANVLGLRESGEIAGTELLINYFRSRTALVIFDNCEHLIDSCAQLINSLLTSCETLSILATSRESLRVAGEISYRVPSLAVPRSDIQSAGNELANMESVKLFTERAAMISPDFGFNAQNALDIARICQRLDGIPLAIELAAARTNLLSTQQILMGLDDRFHLLTRGLRSAMPRHQTLLAMIEWSYDLLTEKEHILFRRLAVFAGGWTKEAAEEVCNGNGIESSEVFDLLSQLVNKSLVMVKTSAVETRYHSLETIRQFAREKLKATNEAEMIRQKHLAYFVDLAERAEPNLRSFDMIVWLDRLEAELDNIRVALTHVQRSFVETQLRLASALLWFWHIRGRRNEGIDWLERGLSIEEEGDNLSQPQIASIPAKALNAAGFLKLMLGATDTGIAFLERSLALFRRHSAINKGGIAYSLWNLAFAAAQRHAYSSEKTLCEESLALFRETGDQFGIAQCLDLLGEMALEHGDFAEAKLTWDEDLALRKHLGDKEGIAIVLGYLGNLAQWQDDYQGAAALYSESLIYYQEVGDEWMMAQALTDLAWVAYSRGNYRQATQRYREALAFYRGLGENYAIAAALSDLARVARSQGNYGQAGKMLEEAIKLARDLNNKNRILDALFGLGEVAWLQGNYEAAARSFEEALVISREEGFIREVPFAIYCLGRVAHSQGDHALARSLHREALVICQEIGDKYHAIAILEALAVLAVAQNQMDSATRLFGGTTVWYHETRFFHAPSERAEHEYSVATARAALGEAAFATGWAEGQAMTVDESVAYALQELR